MKTERNREGISNKQALRIVLVVECIVMVNNVFHLCEYDCG